MKKSEVVHVENVSGKYLVQRSETITTSETKPMEVICKDICEDVPAVLELLKSKVPKFNTLSIQVE